MGILVEKLTKRFGECVPLDDVTLEVPSGELVALLGPSGSGKTTLLRIMAGLEMPDEGRVFFDGEDATRRHARERKVGFVFQHYALFRHMTVFDNVAFGLEVRPKSARPSKGEISDRVHSLLRLVQLDGMAKRYPAQLSGGQRQRVALARALAVEPQVLLLDEPFGALDAQVRADLRRWLRQLHDEIHVTSVFVTHDQEEALEVADRIVVMNRGRIEQTGTPEQVYEHPANPFVLGFLGSVNIFHGRFSRQSGPMPTVSYVRPHDIAIDRISRDPAAVRGEIRHIQKLGPTVRVTIAIDGGGQFVEAEMTRDAYRDLGFLQGERVFVWPREVRVFMEDYQI